MESFDIAVIGGGTGGYTAAIHASHLGARTALIECRDLGGTCLNRGCIPTKSIIASLEALESARKGDLFGFNTGSVSPDISKMMMHKNQVVAKLVQGVETLLKGNGVQVFRGRGELRSNEDIRIIGDDGREQSIRANRVILATGSKPAEFRDFPSDGKQIITSDEALNLNAIPSSILIAGAGAIGVEFTRIFCSLGSKVILVEMENQVLPGTDERISQFLTSMMKIKGILIKTGIAVDRVGLEKEAAITKLSNEETFRTDQVLVAIGRTPNSIGLGLERLGVEMERGWIRTNDRMETNVPGIYAVGDAIGKRLLAYTAAAEGEVAVENALGHQAVIDDRAIPFTIFSSPEVAYVGITGKTARERGIEITLGRFPFAANGRACSLDEPDGWVTLVADKNTDELIGGQIIGSHASDLIAEITLAVRLKAKAKDLAETLHSHPTLTEVVMEAARDIHGKSIHQLRR